jgi:hypothetical protein
MGWKRGAYRHGLNPEIEPEKGGFIYIFLPTREKVGGRGYEEKFIVEKTFS